MITQLLRWWLRAELHNRVVRYAAAEKGALHVATCLSCGVAYGQPHLPTCEFER